MQEVTMYQGDSQALIVAEDATQADTTFLATWLHGRSAKTQRAYTADIRKFYTLVTEVVGRGDIAKKVQ